MALYPYKPEELKMKFSFENEESLSLDYYIFEANVEKMNNNLLGFNKLSNEEFNKFIEDELKKHVDDVNIPNIFEMIKKYKESKGIFEEEEEKSKNDEIQWNYTISGFKCRVDKVNQINVIVQTTFSFDYAQAFDIMDKCAKLFHDNEYKVVVIESNNGGGSGQLALILRQLLQVKIQNKAFLSYKPIELLKYDFNAYPESFINVETCKPYTDFDDFMNGYIDEYQKGNETVYHKRTKVTDILSKEERIQLYNKRKEFYDKNLKKPTDIIILTDSFSYSATSILIKGFQNEGGAIIVGYNGNPKLGDEYFDASQAPSPTTRFNNIEEYIKLKELGIIINGITFGETFDVDYNKSNPIPREYHLDPVDERVDIYESYSDDTYDIFIEKAKEIFKKYNEDGKCNPNNELLVFEDGDKCYNFTDDKYAHGGYIFDGGKWSNSTCKKYYCDLGYYYDKYQDKCVSDMCNNDPNLIEIILDKEYNETIVLNEKNNYEYEFTINTSEYIYFFEANEDGYIQYDVNNPCPSLCVLQINSGSHKNKVHLNYFRNVSDKEVSIKITSINKFNGLAQSATLENNFFIETILSIPNKFIIITEAKDDFILYFKTYDDSYKLYLAEYNEKMNIDDIINVNLDYFKEYNNQVIEPEKDKIYIYTSSSEIPGKLFEAIIQPKYLIKNGYSFTNQNELALYLPNIENTNYTLNFKIIIR